ncbi:MAG TPA: aldehyde dehydrogenase family protein, partial [Holophaga sp.]|nr:aldehyde dehydrogenase family protein [Holophaga sp.]
MDIHGNLIDGAWVAGAEVLRNVDPCHSDRVVGLYASAAHSDAEAAVRAARRALRDWSRSDPQRRFDLLD